MKHLHILFLCCLLATACSRGNGAQSAGCGTRTAGTVKKIAAKEIKPSKPPADWTLEEIAGKYAWGCKGDQWSEAILSADGTFKRVLHVRGDVVTEGKIVRDGDRLALSDKPYAPYLSNFFLRQHRGRKVLVREDAVHSFDLLPSWWMVEVKLRKGEDRDDLCDDMPRWPKENPPDPKNPKVRLPASFTLVIPFTDPGGTSTATVVMKSAPWWAQGTVTEQHGAKHTLSLGRSKDYSRLNRLWWAQARRKGACPAVQSKAAFTLSHGDVTIKGNLPDKGIYGSDISKDPCTALYQLVVFISSKVHTMHPPARTARPPRR